MTFYNYTKTAKPKKPASGFSNFYIRNGRTGLKIGCVDYGLMQINAETIHFRDRALEKQSLPRAIY
jgi:hypothetical protein